MTKSKLKRINVRACVQVEDEVEVETKVKVWVLVNDDIKAEV